MTATLTLLGTGHPGCLPDTYQTAFALVTGDTPIVIDCGGGTVQRLATARANGQPKLMYKNLTTLILTHLHPDHTAGLADFIISTWINGRKEPLKIYGPKGTQRMTELLIEAYELGIAEHWETLSPTTYPLKYVVIEYSDGLIFENDDISITAFRVSHGRMETYGLDCQMADKKLVFSADTMPVDSLMEHGKDCDILVHEAYSVEGLRTATRFSPAEYFERMHTSTVELAAIATELKPKRLILNHQMHLAPMSDAAFMKEITDHYDGEVIFGRDLDVFEV